MEDPHGIWTIKDRDWEVGDEGSLDVAILIVDLVNSSEYASVLSLRDYADYIASFKRICAEQCHFFLGELWRDKYSHDGRDYAIEQVGDEIIVFIHTDRSHDDIYQLVCLAISLKCAWLGAPINLSRFSSSQAGAELAVGIHSGRVWANRGASGFGRSGFAINLTKRTETASRGGERFRIFLTDPAFKQLNRRIRNLIFSPRQIRDMKGILNPVGLYELIDSFVNSAARLSPTYAKSFNEVARVALLNSSFDLWIHSCLQVSEEAHHRCVTDENYELCRNVLGIDPTNPVALYHVAQAERERGALDIARIHLENLTGHWPTLADGWLERGRLLVALGLTSQAREAIQKARSLGVLESEEPLPE